MAERSGDTWAAGSMYETACFACVNTIYNYNLFPHLSILVAAPVQHKCSLFNAANVCNDHGTCNIVNGNPECK